MPSATTPDPRPAACPVCDAPARPAHAPFCSQGCRDRDLLRWLSDGHRLPGPALGEEEAEGMQAGLDSRALRPL